MGCIRNLILSKFSFIDHKINKAGIFGFFARGTAVKLDIK